MEAKITLTRLNRVILILFFLISGANHFLSPGFYLPLIPPYIPYPETVNYVSGVAEIVLAIAFIFERTRKLTAIIIVIMLITFIPAHIYFIEQRSCIEGSLCVPEWVGIVRLLLVHPLIMAWAYFSK